MVFQDHFTSYNLPMTIISKIAQKLKIDTRYVEATIELFDGGSTIPFIARYRKEMTGGLDEEQIRNIKNLLESLRNLNNRRETILASIESQGKLTDALQMQIENSETRTELEDLYQPYKPKRKTRASEARAKGLQPLADLILEQPLKLAGVKSPNELAEKFTNEEVVSLEDAWSGARDIVAEMISDSPAVRQITRQKGMQWGTIHTEKSEKGEDPRRVYESYYDFEFRVNRLRPHQVLAINRGESENILRINIMIPERDWRVAIQENYPLNNHSPLAGHLKLAIEDGVTRLLLPTIKRDIRREITNAAEAHAVKVFSNNLRALLTQPPLIGHVVMGIDPGYRTGCKVAVVDPTGKSLETIKIYPHPPQNASEEAKHTLLHLIQNLYVTLIAIGNGTASRETEGLVAELIREFKREQDQRQDSSRVKKVDLHYLIVSEAGASVYSASELAREELPEIDVSMRGAVSIARRVQDPLAELVKIDPRSLGVGMYQHDIDQKKLTNALDAVVESAVNFTGVDLNSASSALLTYVSGIGPTLASRIVTYRNQHGPFSTRRSLLEVTGLGPKSFEQSAGFLRIRGGRNPFDDTAIHPESYLIAKKLLDRAGLNLNSTPTARKSVLESLLDKESLQDLASLWHTGVPTLEDIIEQLLRPGRDPREDFPLPILRSNVLTMEDLKPGMTLKGTVRNVVDFGAFIDIGVKVDGLLHRSQIPHSTQLSVGNILQIKIIQVEIERGRISLGWSDTVNIL